MSGSRSTQNHGTSRLGLLTQFGLLAGPFLSMVDGSVVNVAIPQIARSFGSPLSQMQWTVSAYLLAMATGLGASSYLARRWGTREIYAASLVGFTVASIACALAGSAGWLIAARLVQGLAGAPLVPLAMGMLLGGQGAKGRMSPAAGVVLFLAPALGPSLGGVLISNLGWPSIFLLNVPFALVGIFGVMKMDGDLAPRRDGGARFDAAGLSLLSAGLALSTYGASQAPITGWWSAAALPFWAVGLAFLAGYAVWARRRQGPAVSLALLADPQGALAIGLSVITGLALFAVLFLVPVYVQDVQGFSAMAAGLMLLPQGFVLAAGTMLGDVLTKRRLVRPGVISGMAILAASTATLALLTPSTPAWTTALLLCGRGFALGLTIQPLIVTTLGRLAPRELADASTLFNIVERVAGSFGVALIGTFFQVRAMSHVDAALGVLPSGGGGLNSLAQLPAPLRALVAIAITDGFHDTIWVLVGLCATGCLASLFLKGRSRGGGTLRVPATVP